MKIGFTGRLVASTMICGSSWAYAAPAYAQQQPAQDSTSAQAQPNTGPAQGATSDVLAQGEAAPTEASIVVTGSRIPQPNLTSASPVTVITSQEVRLQGVTRTEDLINSLPQAMGSDGGNLANGAAGTASVNLRGLGPSRTLVLINGRRLQAGDPAQTTPVPPVPDINFVPAMMIKRVDVLTGGASSVYGADAVSGVVNFIMDTTFTGIRLDSQYSFYDHVNGTRSAITQEITRRNFPLPTGHTADGGTVDVSLMMGAGFGDNHGHVVAYATYRKLNEVLQGSRDYSACALTAQSAAQVTADPSRLYSCGGSANSANGTFFANDGTFQIGPGRTLIAGSTPYNFAPLNHYQRPDERYTAGFFGDYAISESLHPYLEFMFMNDRTVAQTAPSLSNGLAPNINCDNPLLSAQELGIVCAPANLLRNGNGTVQLFPGPNGTTYTVANFPVFRRNVEGGARQNDLEHTDFRLVVGMRGDISNAISYDAYYQYGKVVYNDTFMNDVSVTHLQRALDVVTGPGGQPVCRSVINGSDPNCVPYDMFALGGVTAAASNYIGAVGLENGNTQETVANANVTAKLGEYGIRSPWAEDGVGLNLGLEYRKESLLLRTDQEFSSGDLAGQGGAVRPEQGAYTVREAFVETRIPIVSRQPFFYNLSFGAGYRYSHYSTAASQKFNTSTYKFEAEWAPVRDLRFRGSYNRAVRSPNIFEFFAENVVTNDGTTDPCSGAAPTASLAACQRMGVTQAEYAHVVPNPASQYLGLVGGNPSLTPEVATTKTLGVVLQPGFIPGLAFTADWFDIKINNQIGRIGADLILSQCVSSSQFCNLVHRDSSGSLWLTPNGYVVDTSLNVGSRGTRGIDFSAAYQRSLGGIGTLALSMVGTLLSKLDSDPLGAGDYNCAGLYGATCGVPAPKWRSKTRATFTMPDGIGVSLQWRYFGSVLRDTTSSDPNLTGAVRPADRKIPSQSYFDLTLTARIGDHYSLRLGVDNILDREPPVATQLPGLYGSGNTFPEVYDTLGRYVFAGITLDF